MLISIGKELLGILNRPFLAFLPNLVEGTLSRARFSDLLEHTKNTMNYLKIICKFNTSPFYLTTPTKPLTLGLKVSLPL